MQSPRCLIHRRFIADSTLYSLSRVMVVGRLVTQLLDNYWRREKNSHELFRRSGRKVDIKVEAETSAFM
jgi:hypothetical protein